MASTKEKHWTYYLGPIWVGTCIGVVLGLLVFILGWAFNVDHTETFYWGGKVQLEVVAGIPAHLHFLQ
jgi:hypothetical protein